MLTVTKKFSFCYGHHLPDYDGKCATYHGHNSEVEVEVAEIPDEIWEQDGFLKTYPSMTIDFTVIKAYVKPIIDELDHKNLNDIFAHPTAETITEHIVNKIKAINRAFELSLFRVRVTETPTSWAEWKRDY